MATIEAFGNMAEVIPHAPQVREPLSTLDRTTMILNEVDGCRVIAKVKVDKNGTRKITYGGTPKALQMAQIIHNALYSADFDPELLNKIGLSKEIVADIEKFNQVRETDGYRKFTDGNGKHLPRIEVKLHKKITDALIDKAKKRQLRFKVDELRRETFRNADTKPFSTLPATDKFPVVRRSMYPTKDLDKTDKFQVDVAKEEGKVGDLINEISSLREQLGMTKEEIAAQQRERRIEDVSYANAFEDVEMDLTAARAEIVTLKLKLLRKTETKALWEEHDDYLPQLHTRPPQISRFEKFWRSAAAVLQAVSPSVATGAQKAHIDTYAPAPLVVKVEDPVTVTEPQPAMTIESVRELVLSNGYMPETGKLLFAKVSMSAKPAASAEEGYRYASTMNVIKAFWPEVSSNGKKAEDIADILGNYPTKFKRLQLSSLEIRKIAHLLPEGAIVVFSHDATNPNSFVHSKGVALDSGFAGFIGMRPSGEPIIVGEREENRGKVFDTYGKSIVQVFIPTAEPTRFHQVSEKHEVMTDTQLAEYLVKIHGDKLNSVNVITGLKNYPTETYKIEFFSEIIQMSKRLNPDNPYLANQIAAAMRFESGFKPDAKNPWSTATGLIQFMTHYGMDRDKFAAMKPIEQLKFVERYLSGKGELNNIYDVYMAILWPVAVGKDPEYVIMRRGDGIYEVNPLDKNGDGKTTVNEATTAVIEPSVKAGEKRENLLPSERKEILNVIHPSEVVMGLVKEAPKPGEYTFNKLDTDQDYVEALKREFGVNYIGFTKRELGWYWDMWWTRLTNTNVPWYSTGATIAKDTYTAQEGGPSADISIRMKDYDNKQLAQDMHIHELSHLVVNSFGYREEFKAIYNTEGYISHYGSGNHSTPGREPYTEDSAEGGSFALGSTFEAVRDPNRPGPFINPFYGVAQTEHPRIWAFYVKVLGLRALDGKIDDRLITNDENEKVTQLYGVTKWSAANPSYYLLQTSNGEGIHPGVDLGLLEGTKLFSPVAGDVTAAGFSPNRGNYVTLRTVRGDITMMHLSEISVKTGNRVPAGVLLGLSGNTGPSEAAHLHLQVNDSKTGTLVDPTTIFDFSNNLMDLD